MTDNLTDRQREILAYIAERINTESSPPTVREIALHFAIASPRGVSDHLLALERKGCIMRSPRKSRGIRLTNVRKGIPIIGTVAAGAPILAVENFSGMLDLTDLSSRHDIFAVRVKGESMKNCGIMDGDYVIVRDQPQVENGTIAVAYVNGEATIKRIFKTRDGYALVPENDGFVPLLVDDRVSEFRVAGPVIRVVRTKVT